MTFEFKKHKTLDDFKQENAPLIKFPLPTILVKSPDGCYDMGATARFHEQRIKQEERRLLQEARESAHKSYLNKPDNHSYKLMK